MTSTTDELDRLRGELVAARQRDEHDRATIQALRKEVGEQRREAQHRVRNILSVVRSIARRTAEEDETAEEYRARLDSRLASFARLQGHVLRDPPGGVDLCTLVADELLAFGIGLGAGAEIVGDPTGIKPQAASVLGLAFHELARMAIDRSPRASLAGRIDVSWRLAASEGEPTELHIDWIETSEGSRLVKAADQSFGLEVLEQAIAYGLAGTVTIDTSGTQLACRFRLPTGCLVQEGTIHPVD